MRYEIVLAPHAVEDVGALSARLRSEVFDALEVHLRHEPSKVSRSRIKRLSGLRQPQFRLRVGDVRVYYDLEGPTVQVLAIISKAETIPWLAKHGKPA